MSELFGFPPGRRSFFLGQISEPSTNRLRLVLVEGAAQGPVVESVDDINIPGREILPLPQAEAVVVLWESYVGYAVRNESYALEKGVPKVENMLVERDASAFRDFVRHATWATDDHPGKLRHFEVICEHHVIDVISIDTPKISRETVVANGLMESTVRVFNRA
jgi:hypothetical protein